MGRWHNAPGTLLCAPSQSRLGFERKEVDRAPYKIDSARREVVLAAIQEVCGHRPYTLVAVHVRTHHVHVVVQASERPEKVMNAFKAYASRRLNDGRFDPPDRKRWTRHGSTHYLWTEAEVEDAVEYVFLGQGQPLDMSTTHPYRVIVFNITGESAVSEEGFLTLG